MNIRVTYRHEYLRRIRVGYIGCGGHSYRNVLPTFAYCPIDLVATCDLDADKARAFARQFGAERFYADYREMLTQEALDAVFIVTGYDRQTRKPLYPPLAMDAMQAGCHVWMEKPPAASADEIRAMMAVSEQTKKFVMVGFKKCFFPAIEKVKDLIGREEFGHVGTIYVRYPQSIPLPEQMRRYEPPAVGFLDHIVHPASILVYLMGDIQSVFYERSPNGSGSALLKFANGATGVLHLTAGQSGTSPLERLEVTGSGANVVVDNGIKLTYYRPGARGAYGRSSHYFGADEQAPIYWEPEFSLGQLYNQGIFLLGYWGEVYHFAECVLNDRPPRRCDLRHALEVMKLYEAFKQPPGMVITL
ncbi:MAG: Gfo/Idh/MocA family oxidoreductase [Abditibacteriales bacterium]|nr:Gfo/Idh/MocA family oxidoreductase [Abditibacteriales bacterium]MDW8368137.1 Gfo/Idh/MocA family oxidoreductase [Abditibacteriales bacterium]